MSHSCILIIVISIIIIIKIVLKRHGIMSSILESAPELIVIATLAKLLEADLSVMEAAVNKIPHVPELLSELHVKNKSKSIRSY